MNRGYLAVFTGRGICRELRLGTDCGRLRAGTEPCCELRFDPALFPVPFRLDFLRTETGWQVLASETVYLSSGAMTALLRLVPGEEDSFAVRYREQALPFLTVFFSVDYDAFRKEPDLRIPLFLHPASAEDTVFSSVSAETAQPEQKEPERGPSGPDCAETGLPEGKTPGEEASGLRILRAGAGPDCELRLHSRFSGTEYFELRCSGETCLLVPGTAGSGIRRNGRRVTEPVSLQENDFISAAEISFCYSGGSLYLAAEQVSLLPGLPAEPVRSGGTALPQSLPGGRLRPERFFTGREILLPVPPELPQAPGAKELLQLLPTVLLLAVSALLLRAGQSVWVNLSMISAGGSALIGILSILCGQISCRKKRRERELAFEKLLESRKTELLNAREKELQWRKAVWQGPAALIETACGAAGEACDRNPDDPDFLDLTLGTGDAVPLSRIICSVDPGRTEPPADPSGLFPADFAEGPAAAALRLLSETAVLRDAPVILPLGKAGCAGFAGPAGALSGMFRTVCLDLAVRQSPQDLELWIFAAEKEAEDCAALRFLPHLAEPESGLRRLACTHRDRKILLERLFRELSGREREQETGNRSGNRTGAKPRLAVLSYGTEDLLIHPVSEYLKKTAETGSSFLFFTEGTAGRLPACCHAAVSLAENGGPAGELSGTCLLLPETEDPAGYTQKAEYARSAGFPDRELRLQNPETEFRLLPPGRAAVSRAARLLASARPAGMGEEAGLPRELSLYDLLDILGPSDLAAASAWERNHPSEGITAPVGILPDGTLFQPDLCEKKDGPHGLIAGTTGSGKSEFLRTLLLSLALRYHPQELGFLVIDFKGGGLVRELAGLPHLLGAVTDLDGRGTEKALLSLRAELKKRERLFAEAGVYHIDAWQQLYRQGGTACPLPHLILVVDEFAELKENHPELMGGLVSASRLGRSLGVHLLLSTQKPSGAVDAQIRANTGFRICFRVQDAEESREVLNSPLAAVFREPGRACMETGASGELRIFQAACAALPEKQEEKEKHICRVELSGKRIPLCGTGGEKRCGRTQAEALAESVRETACRLRIPALSPVFLPQLPARINRPLKPASAETAAGEKTAERKTAGHNAAGEKAPGLPLGIAEDPERQEQGPLYWRPESGSLLITGGRGSGKTAALVTLLQGAAEKITGKTELCLLDFSGSAQETDAKLPQNCMLLRPFEEEKIRSLFRRMETEGKPSGDRPEQEEAGNRFLLLIDGLPAFREAFPELEDRLLRLLRPGSARGIAAAATAGSASGIGYRLLSCFENRLFLSGSRQEDLDLLPGKRRTLPEEVPGRGLILTENRIRELQVFLPSRESAEPSGQAEQ